MSGVHCERFPTCMEVGARATIPTCDKPDCPGKKSWEGYPPILDSRAEIMRLRGELEKANRAYAQQVTGLEAMRARKDAAYEERNRVVAALARLFPSGLARTNIPGWSDDWHGCVYIDLPTGQVSWHYHDSQSALFTGLPPYAGSWDGHDTPEKYRRLAALRASPQQEQRREKK